MPRLKSWKGKQRSLWMNSIFSWVSSSRKVLMIRLRRQRSLSLRKILNHSSTVWSNILKKKTSSSLRLSSSPLLERRWPEQPLKPWLRLEKLKKSSRLKNCLFLIWPRSSRRLNSNLIPSSLFMKMSKTIETSTSARFKTHPKILLRWPRESRFFRMRLRFYVTNQERRIEYLLSARRMFRLRFSLEIPIGLSWTKKSSSTKTKCPSLAKRSMKETSSIWSLTVFRKKWTL